MKEKIIKKNENEEMEEISQKKLLNKNEKNKDIIIFFQKTVSNTISAFFLSLISTVVNFTCNIPLLRKVSKESYGIVKVYFELAFTLINFIPRETLRRTSQKFCPDKDPKKEKEKFITLSQINYLLLFLTSIISIIIFFCFIFFTDNEKLHENYIQLMIYIICALLELIIEPVIMYMNLHMENKLLPITISSLSRVISNTIFIAFFDMDLWGFTLSRILGTTIYISYIIILGVFKYKLNFYEFLSNKFLSLIFDKSTNKGTNLVYLREILYQFIKLNLLNIVLSKCQNLVLSFILKNSEEEKSDYSFISQNFSLISRFLLEPIIDTFYNLVNKIKFLEKKRKEDINQENEKSNINELKDTKKEINYELVIKLLQFFIKIFIFIGVLIIPYYILIGTEVMGLIYGEKWQTNTIDKIGDCYSYFVVIIAISDLIKNFGNATYDTHQMNLSYISLILNAFILSLFMYTLSKWDICGLILTNVLSAVFLINFNLYIVLCGKNQNNKIKNYEKFSIVYDIEYFIRKCFISKKSIIITVIFVTLGEIFKKTFVLYDSLYIIFVVSFLGLINGLFIYRFEYNDFIKELNDIKSYQ